MKALIFGDTGFLGHALTSYLLNRGHDVIGVSRKNVKAYWPKFVDNYEHVRLDLSACYIGEVCNLLDKYKPTHIYHYANNPLVKDFREADNRVNIQSTHKILDAIDFCKSGAKLIYASSATVYGLHNIVRTTLDNVNPSSVYAMSKVFSENLIKYYSNLGKIKDYLILRYCAHVGKDATHGVCKDIVDKLQLEGRYLELLGKAPGSIKPYLYIDDSMNATLFYTLNASGIYNIAPKNMITVEEVANLIMKELNIQKEINWSGKTWAGDDIFVSIYCDYNHIRSSEQAVIDYVRSL